MGFERLRTVGPGEAACRFAPAQPVAARRLLIAPADRESVGIGQIEVLDGTVPYHGAQGAETLPVEDIKQYLECPAR